MGFTTKYVLVFICFIASVADICCKVAFAFCQLMTCLFSQYDGKHSEPSQNKVRRKMILFSKLSESQITQL